MCCTHYRRRRRDGLDNIGFDPIENRYGFHYDCFFIVVLSTLKRFPSAGSLPIVSDVLDYIRFRFLVSNSRKGGGGRKYVEKKTPPHRRIPHGLPMPAIIILIWSFDRAIFILTSPSGCCWMLLNHGRKHDGKKRIWRINLPAWFFFRDSYEMKSQFIINKFLMNKKKKKWLSFCCHFNTITRSGTLFYYSTNRKERESNIANRQLTS